MHNHLKTVAVILGINSPHELSYHWNYINILRWCEFDYSTHHHFTRLAERERERASEKGITSIELPWLLAVSLSMPRHVLTFARQQFDWLVLSLIAIVHGFTYCVSKKICSHSIRCNRCLSIILNCEVCKTSHWRLSISDANNSRNEIAVPLLFRSTGAGIKTNRIQIM